MKAIISRFQSVVVKLSLLSAILWTTPPAQANITVTNLADSGPGSLRQAIADAKSGDTIVFAVAGTITLTTGQLIITNNLTINGPGAANLIVSASNSSRVISNGRGNTLSISGLTLADGTAGDNPYDNSYGAGGGILNAGGALALSECIISNCVADAGGGVYSLSVYNSGANLSLSRCTITKNIAHWGMGGGIWNQEVLSISDSTICANNGGGVYSSVFSTVLSNCTISGNTGDGVNWFNAAAPGYDVRLANCTVCVNSGFGIRYESTWGTVTVLNTILSGNSGGTGPDCSGVLKSGDYNLIQNTNGCTITGATAHNIYNQDPLLGPLADNGGPTPTHALRFNSPALDSGSSSGLATDQRGIARPVDSPEVANVEGGDGSDIGAYEVNPSTQMSIYTAVEIEFGTTLGRTYRVESSTDMVTWSQVESGIVGTGGPVARLYTTRTIPKRFFQAVQE